MTPHLIKSRFSPSPTGLMHLGNLRTALFNVLLAKSYHAQNTPASFLLRIEDTDMSRSQMEFAVTLLRDLRWLQLEWQEGPEHPGGHGPYFQSQRLEIYDKYYQQLLARKHAYWCFCSETELAIARKNQLNAGMAPRYSGTCRHLTEEQVEAKKNKGIIPALRFQIPDKEMIHFEDFIQGPKSFAAEDIGDFIIKKADGSSSFMFCNAVDDSLMEVTHVMRGEDHLTNTPRQLLILKALGLRAPQYGHMSLILGNDGKPLSKRNGSQSVEALREQGYFPLAIVNYLARLGHHLENEKLLSLDALGEHFSIKHVGRSPARFDLAQLNHWQKETVMHHSTATLWEWIAPFVNQWVSEKATLFTETIKQNIVLPHDAKEWAIQLLTDQLIWDEDSITHLKEAGNEMLEAVEQAITLEGENYSNVVNHITQKTQKKGKALFLPLRSAITGRSYGPELVKIFHLMGKEALLNRVEAAKKIMQQGE